MAYLHNTRETQLSPFVLTLHIQVMCRVHALFRGMLSRELFMKTLLSSIAWVFTFSLSITQPLQLNPTINKGYKRLNKITIKFGTKLKLTKHIVVNYNFIERTWERGKQRQRGWDCVGFNEKERMKVWKGKRCSFI